MNLLYKWTYKEYSIFIYKMMDSDMFSLLFFGPDIVIQNFKFKPRPSWCDSIGVLLCVTAFITGNCHIYRALQANGKISPTWETFTKSSGAKEIYNLPNKSKYLTCVQKQTSSIV